MCRSFALFDDVADVTSLTGYPLDSGATFPPPHFNISPGAPIIAIGAVGDEIQVTAMRWGYKPRWAPNDTPSTHVARAESLASKRYFKGAFTRHRCLVPVNGWYEWKYEGDEQLPFYFSVQERPRLYLAGIFTRLAEGGQGCAIVTEPARGKAKEISRRMPVVVAAGAEAWLDPTITDRETLKRYLRPLAPGTLNARQVDSTTDSSTQNYGGQNHSI
ncbi:SOS response-associated peptidase [Vreelandella titanicae]|uniref:Abasic site processing protein n=1 Tax=Vreelandella titanicae TaxID=664683 RepID=A0A558J126_9GAMM|nr:SOS response-associated peptidase [Halomonas titanicae]TVU87316.1 SOS response-associated peptidase [Halomonas titanicae]